MFLTLSKKNVMSAAIDDKGWPFVEVLGQQWERTEPGVWQNNNTGEIAIRQDDGNWEFNGKTFTCIKKIMFNINLHQQPV